MPIPGTKITSGSDASATTWAEKLAVAKLQLDQLLQTPVEEYRSNDGTGTGQQYRYRKIKELESHIDYLERKAAQETNPRPFILPVFRNR